MTLMPGKISRRAFLHSSVILAGGNCIYRSAYPETLQKSNCCFTPKLEPDSYFIQENKVVIHLDKAFTLQEPGHAAELDLPEHSVQIILVHKSKNQYYALSKLCTHAYRNVGYIHEREVLQCTNFSHATFDLQGKVLKGPAKKPLKSYTIRQFENRLIISITDESKTDNSN
ncbi:MAG: Rieske 2Fe-2S domain-containing protein [Candidatus Marinimicrobia bacterium]|nr:Rieske 2Fe-2S domain-containing protein [Candidatus Neomarinimicrobiota bacterium]